MEHMNDLHIKSMYVQTYFNINAATARAQQLKTPRCPVLKAPKHHISVTELCYPVAVTEQKHSQTWPHLKRNVALMSGRIKVFSVN
jgi:hypothetical protein